MKKKTLFASALILASALGCSLVNSFPNVKPEGNGGEGTGGTSETGGDSMGGDASGGTGGSGTGSTGTGGSVQVEPGLVVAAGHDAEQYAVLALSPQTGKELGRLEMGDYVNGNPSEFAGAYRGVAHEAERDLWFFLSANSVRAAKFDKITNKWTLQGTADTAIEGVGDFDRVFAENKLLVYITASGQMQALDTTDPAKPTKAGSALGLAGTAGAGLSFWEITASPTASGMATFELYRHCEADPCDIVLQRYNVSSSGINAATSGTVGTVPATELSAKGGVAYDRFNQTLLVSLPFAAPEVLSQTTGHLLSLGLSNFSVPADPAIFKQIVPDNSRLQIDPCNQYSILGSPLDSNVRAKPLSSDEAEFTSTEASWPAGTQQGILFEPFTGSVLARVANGSSQGVFAARLSKGTPKPSFVKRSGDWAPPTFSPQFGWAVSYPKDFVCP